MRQMIHETTGRPVGRIDWTNKTPSRRRQLSRRRSFHFHKERASMNGPKVTIEPSKINLFSCDDQTGHLLETKARF